MLRTVIHEAAVSAAKVALEAVAAAGPDGLAMLPDHAAHPGRVGQVPRRLAAGRGRGA